MKIKYLVLLSLFFTPLLSFAYTQGPYYLADFNYIQSPSYANEIRSYIDRDTYIANGIDDCNDYGNECKVDTMLLGIGNIPFANVQQQVTGNYLYSPTDIQSWNLSYYSPYITSTTTGLTLWSAFGYGGKYIYSYFTVTAPYVYTEQTVFYDTQFKSYTISTSTRTFTVNGYINPTDFNSSEIKTSFVVSTPLFDNWYQEEITATSSGNFSYSFIFPNFSTSTFSNFTFTSQIFSPSICEDSFSWCSTVYDTISTTSLMSNFATSSVFTPELVNQGVADNCNILSPFYFSAQLCISYLFIPNSQQIDNNINTLKNSFINRVPIGYVTRVYNILNSTSTKSIPVLSATIPTGYPGSGSSISLDVNGVLDDVLDRNPVLGSYATTTETFYSITSYYWNIIVYLLFAFYIIRRIIGAHLFGNLKHKQK